MFVSKHNQSFNITERDVLEYCASHGIITTSIDDSHNPVNKDYRCTNSHVIVQNCPSCTNIQDKITNQYKLYICTNGTGAYFCHRCGWKGSWFDFKHTINQSASSPGSAASSTHGERASTTHYGTAAGNASNSVRPSASSPYSMNMMTAGSSRYASTSTDPSSHTKMVQVGGRSTEFSDPDSFHTVKNGNGGRSGKKSQQKSPPLPMPPARLQALYSTSLLDVSTTIPKGEVETTAATTTEKNHAAGSNKVLDYLLNVRGLNISTLRKYGVGRAMYSFADNNNNWVSTECVTFPWIITVADAEYQESLRGSKFEWDQAEQVQQQLDEQQQLYRESSYQQQQQQQHQANTGTSTESTLLLTNNTNMTVDSSCSIAADGDDDEQPMIGTAKDTTSTSTIKAPPTIQEIKEETFITRRIKVRSVERKDWQRMDPPGGGWGLFGYHTIPNHKPAPSTDDKKKHKNSMKNEPREEREIIITEGEYDAMAVWQATHRPAISLPNGCRSLPVEVLPLLEEFTKIYLWMDNDAAGQDGAEQFAKKLGLERCYIVKPTFSNCRRLTPSTNPTSVDTDPKKKIVGVLTPRPTPQEMVKQLPKDANDALRQGLDLSLILADAQLVRHDRIIRFSDLRDEVLHEIMHPDQYVGHPMNSLPGFTNIIKGFRRGELSVLTGPTGSGKTTFLGQLSVDLVEQDVNVLWGSFEIKNIRLIHKLMQQFAREPLPTGDPTMKDKLEALSDRFDRLPFTFLKFHGGTDVDDVLDAMDYAVYVNDVEHIILDNMQFMVSLNSLKGKGSSSSFDKFDVQDMAIEKFRKFATDRNVHIMLVVHPKKEAENANLSISSIYGTAKATQEADTVLILQNDGRRKFLEVKKNRFNGTLGHTPLHFDRKSCRYGEVPAVNVSGSDSGSHSSPSSSGMPSNNNSVRPAYNNTSTGQRHYSKRADPSSQPAVEAKDWFIDYYANPPTGEPSEWGRYAIYGNSPHSEIWMPYCKYERDATFNDDMA